MVMSTRSEAADQPKQDYDELFERLTVLVEESYDNVRGLGSLPTAETQLTSLSERCEEFMKVGSEVEVVAYTRSQTAEFAEVHQKRMNLVNRCKADLKIFIHKKQSELYTSTLGPSLSQRKSIEEEVRPEDRVTQTSRRLHRSRTCQFRPLQCQFTPTTRRTAAGRA